MKEEIPTTVLEARVKKAADEMEAELKKDEKESSGKGKKMFRLLLAVDTVRLI